ncbi:MAG: hypothetical protein CMP10_14925 [Zetaproteobacteria bacterium]|nr:hypothetical protein [Pseudobdellovibrionaceae bacterium]
MDIGKAPTSWRSVKSLEAAKELVDYGAIISWKDMKSIRKELNKEDQLELVRHFAVRLAERVENRLPEEIILESLLVFLAHTQDDEVLAAFLGELLVQPNRVEACFLLVELAITSEITEEEHDEDIFALAVALICELGLGIQNMVHGEYGADFEEAPKLIDHIATYLLSVSNHSNNCVRLSLLNYFGEVARYSNDMNGFNRIMNRFGHTVLEHLFLLLFNKRSEAIALQFLLDNIPFVLQADNQSQRILHQTWKFYMLKKPERFSLFLQTLAKHLKELPESESDQPKRIYMQHLAMLLKVASEVNHRDLGREIMCAMVSFAEDSYKDEIVNMVIQDQSIRGSFRDLLERLNNAKDFDQVIDGTPNFRSSKRGRKPSFARTDSLKTINQVSFLGQQQVERAG